MNLKYPDKLYVEAEDHALYNEIRSKNDSEILIPFRSLKEIFIFSGMIGWTLGQKKELSSRKELIYHHYLDEKFDKPLILAAYYDSCGKDIVEIDPVKAVNMFEEYANLGFKILFNEIIKKSYNKTYEIADYLINNKYL